MGAVEKHARKLLAAQYRAADISDDFVSRCIEGDAMLTYQEQMAVAAIASALKPQWQPIATAPRDGTLILLGRAGDEADDRAPISTPGRWLEGYEDAPDDMGHDDGFMDVEFQEFSCPRTFGAESYRTNGFQPTHWQPMPLPPEVE